MNLPLRIKASDVDLLLDLARKEFLSIGFPPPRLDGERHCLTEGQTMAIAYLRAVEGLLCKNGLFKPGDIEIPLIEDDSEVMEADYVY